MKLSAYILPIALVLLAIVIGINGARNTPAQDSTEAVKTSELVTKNNLAIPLTQPSPIPKKVPPKEMDEEHSESSPFEVPNEKILTFGSIKDLEDFLNSPTASNLSILGRSNHLLSLRIRLSSLSDLRGGSIPFEESANFLVVPPLDPEAVSAQANAVGIGDSLLDRLGIHSDNSLWGKGVTIAVIDSGISEHSSLPSFQTITTSATAEEFHGHGTAVASIIAGLDKIAPGIAPASSLISVPITDSTGASTSFALAEGIIAAVDSGAQILNISLGSYGDSLLVSQAVNYAFDKGAVIVASSGNEGLDFSAYPSAYPSVISVGAVDATGAHLLFSNTSNDLSMTAPGYQVNTAWTENSYVQSSGTSFSAPAVSGAISAVLSTHPNLSPQEAAEIVVSHSNEAGKPGQDPLQGNGQLDVGRAINYDTPGIVDPAVASHYIAPADSTSSRDQVLVTIQNQGTTDINGIPLTVRTDTQTHSLQSGLILAGQTETFHLPMNFVPLLDGGSTQIQSTIGPYTNDSDLGNNALRTTLSLPTSP